MKSILNTYNIPVLFFAAITLMSSCSNEFKHEGLTSVFETEAVFKSPECIVVNSAENCFYVSNINNRSTDKKDGDGFISKVSLDGKILELEWITGINDPRGMSLIEDTLWVADIDELVKISVSNGTILEKIKIDGATALNDISINESAQKLYTSDFRGNKVFTLENFQTQAEPIEINKPNGLLTFNEQLFIGTFDTENTLSVINADAKETLWSAECKIDGLAMYEQPDALILSNYDGQLLILDKTSQSATYLLKTEQHKVADFAFIPNQNMVIIPALDINKVLAYKINL